MKLIDDLDKKCKELNVDDLHKLSEILLKGIAKLENIDLREKEDALLFIGKSNKLLNGWRINEIRGDEINGDL